MPSGALYPVDGHELAWAGPFVPNSVRCSPLGIENHDARVHQSVDDQDTPVGEKRHVLRLLEMLLLLPLTFFSPSVITSFLPSFEKTWI